MTTILIIYAVLLFPAAGMAWGIIEPDKENHWGDGDRMNPWFAWLVWLVCTALWPVWVAVVLLIQVWYLSCNLGDKINRMI